jgi:hypothetical protein
MKKALYIIIAVAIIGGIVWLIMTPGKAGKYDAFAQCIKDKKTVTFFGAFWCPHCQAQKARFGKSAEYLPYVECSTPDGQRQTQECINQGIVTYPTWEFATGTTPSATTTTRITGEVELEKLAELTQCQLPA